MRARNRHPVLVLVTLLLVALAAAYGQPTQETELEVTNVQFEPLRQGKNVVRVEVRNRSDEDQVFRTHIGTRSPEYGPGVGWGTGFFETIPADQTIWTRFGFKIQGPMTESTYVRLTFSNPGTQREFDEDTWLKREGWNEWFQRTQYPAGDLKWAEQYQQAAPLASPEQARAVTTALRQIQDGIRGGDYAQAWQHFTRDYQQAEFQSTDSESLMKVMEPQRPIEAAFGWQKEAFIALNPLRVVRENDRLVVLAQTQDQTWTLDFVRDADQWKLDSLVGYTPQLLKWQNWEDYVLPRMEMRRTEHFDIHYFKDSTAQARVEQLVKEKERGYREICDFLDHDPNLRIRLVLFEDMQTKQWETGHQGMGWAYGTTIVEVYNEAEQLDPFHETVHILMGPVGSPPALFNEGFAVYMSQRLGAHALEDLGGGTATIAERAAALKAQGEWIDPKELMTYTEIGSRESRPPVAYAEAASFVQHLIETYGKDKFLQAYSTLKNSNQPDVHRQNAEALANICDRSFQQLCADWDPAS